MIDLLVLSRWFFKIVFLEDISSNFTIDTKKIILSFKKKTKNKKNLRE